MYDFFGTLHYSNDEDGGMRLVLNVSQDLADYYRSLMPKYLRPLKPRWAAHITVVRPMFEKPTKIRYWEEYEGENVTFIYYPYVLSGTGYYWINAWSKQLEQIRSELGLFNVSQAVRPVGYDKTFHITIGKYEEYFPSGSEPEK